ncbi:MAG TPA: KUP/HAK/KT family potassium transporter, partial [Thermoanaerobaculia bacterium]|nr:KUP/HAK/KT family potassium transporter [Thermoanaerobaculia bacterium]
MSSGPKPSGGRLALLSLGALGIVYGDIGTSPLYALRESLSPEVHGLPVSAANVLGVLSLIVWSLVLLVGVKYVGIILRADNEGEGGILALMSLVNRSLGRDDVRRRPAVVLGLFGAALLYGDGLITPAISVLSAVEGLKTRSPALEPFVVPLAVLVLVLLFVLQRHGTARIGAFFGPVMLLWFGVLGALGAWHAAHVPKVFAALDPRHAVAFFAANGLRGFFVLGSVVLVVTGGEAVYADMGHFGARPIRVAWFGFVLPALLLNYFGQGALLLRSHEAMENPLFAMVPPRWVLPLVVLATAATTIASQALISGVFSLTRQAVQLGFLPRLLIRHTSATERGQIYLPAINWALLAGCTLFVLVFGSSSRLAAAYGVAVTATMLLTTLLFFVLLDRAWNIGTGKAAAICGGFLLIELAFFGANVAKLFHGGWIPLILGWFLYTLMVTWKQGRRIVVENLRKAFAGLTVPIAEYVRRIEAGTPPRIPHPAVYLERYQDLVPPSLYLNWQHNRALHDPVILLTVETADVPRVSRADRTRIEALGAGFYRVVLTWGFMEEPDVPAGLRGLRLGETDLDPERISYFLGRAAIISVPAASGMARWRERLY